jgi:DNA repair exonuclease SbcCD ATPase subunit
MQKLHEKIEELTKSKKEISDRIADLHAKKRNAADAANEALAKGDIDSAVKCQKLLEGLESDIRAHEEILAVLEREKPFDKDIFNEEFKEFQEQQEAALSKKFGRIVNGLIELDKLYSDYEADYRWYESQHEIWRTMGDRISLGQLPKIVNKVAGWMHGKIRNSLPTLIRNEDGRINQ